MRPAAGVLYTKGLTQEQVDEVFGQIYGQQYSKASISRMVESVRTQVNECLGRGLEEYDTQTKSYPME